MNRRTQWEVVATGALLLFSVCMFALHFVHLGADFPNHSPWMDWAKYTDEGWYGDAAIRYYLHGTWRVPGDFNPGAALPVWPLLEAVLFRFTGVGIVAARALAVAVFGGIALCSFLLLNGSTRQSGRTARSRSVFAAAAAALLTTSPFVYVFTRMAILEPLLILLLLCALLLAGSVATTNTTRSRVVRLTLVGLLAALMVGTKTTAIFLLPAVVSALLGSTRWSVRPALRNIGIAALCAALPASLYLLLLWRRGLFADVRYLFTANDYTGITRQTIWPVIWEALKDGWWTGAVLYPATLAILLLLLFHRNVWKDSVFTSLALWAGGYLAYIAYHANFQPRYYLVVAVPLILLFVRGAFHLQIWRPVTLYALAPIFVVMLALDVHDMSRYVLHPEYSFQSAAAKVERVVMAEPSHSHIVLSISGSNLSLMTGLPSICDDFGTMQLEDRIAAYRPGWFVTWNYVEDDKMQALSRFYHLTRMVSMPAMDDPERNLMIVYRLDERNGVLPALHGRKRERLSEADSKAQS